MTKDEQVVMQAGFKQHPMAWPRALPPCGHWWAHRSALVYKLCVALRDYVVRAAAALRVRQLEQPATRVSGDRLAESSSE